MTVVVKVADDRYIDPSLGKAIGNVWYGLGSLASVHSDANELGPGTGELFDLEGCPFDVNGVGISHGLNDYWIFATDFDRIYVNCDRSSSIDARQISSFEGRVVIEDCNGRIWWEQCSRVFASWRRLCENISFVMQVSRKDAKEPQTQRSNALDFLHIRVQRFIFPAVTNRLTYLPED